ncbi:protein EFR3 homolog B isoform X1 [Arachis ipaensis]|uniref:Uncharacterized protein n=1 Tax=Arachis hypogaea TaxID=3818 RepID=A0A444XJT8_ARAHY|nr:protein EFR3 homolog B isoform X1 [Arachis ipaensis]XP_016175645.1 protein EFR3 homolog B isoform X1 [Arachis ipaensis]XP_025675267.1 protein EFR3 homolog B isoform X1 [Arachis hypogaea]XP_025675268.1 protein EFR3 homolog B isoform X1 [Arachis hypogaea]QHN77266.1 uncharacterized protein DS421_19g651140 [Arachis hypogaea]QHN77267.1 uncharacterized protein DS421_19g651140 [Arachis hypogaea]RYQ89947.1 hypothetical protein Ahy_B09g096325 isoform A [Arachis hypogaea]
MGIISRKIFPACGSMCVCCPALRSRSRQPVKRYRKLLADIFPKSPDEFPSERKIIKLCEYAARNPFRIPKIAKHLEERCYKELRSEHIKIKPVKIVAETFNKLISVCKVQIAYFAVNVLDVMSELLGCSKDETIQTLGCQVLTTFIYSQVDATYTHNMEKLVRKVCMLSREHVGALEKRCLRASSLQCLSAMIWFMAEFSHIFVDLDEIIDAVLDNYKCGTPIEDGGVRAEPHHNWVDEVVRREGRGGSVVSDGIHSSCSIIQPEPEKKDPSRLTREESETPEIWAQICIQRMVELAKERSTMRRVMDRMFVYFDSRQHWAPQQGLAAKVLSSMAYFMENSAFSTGNQQLILTCVVHHLDHKNVMNDPKLKTYIVQVATSLSMQIRSGAGLKEIGFVGDLCRHLRKSLQSSGSEFVGEQEFNVNISLQNSIEDCLLEIANGVTDTQPLFDLMAITLESLPSGPLARATIGSVIVLARVVTLALSRLNSQQGFPEVLLVQLLKVMLHPDLEARVGAHVIFSGLLFPSSFQTHDDSSIRSVYTDRHSKKSFQTASTSASITALLEKLRKDQDGIKTEGHGSAIHDGCKEKDITAEDYKPGYGLKNSPNFCKLSSIIDRAMGSPSLTDTELGIMKLNEDQIGQLLSSFWIQANLPDNLPANFEAISHSFISTLLVLRAKNLKDKDNLLIRFFQLPLSLWTMLLDSSNGMLPPSHQRSVFVLSTGMLMSACKVYQIHDLNDVFTSLAMSEVDPFLGINDDHQVYVKVHVDLREYGTAADNQVAMSVLSDLRSRICKCDEIIKNHLAQNLANITELHRDNLTTLLSETFKPDEEFVYGPQSILDHNKMNFHPQDSLSFDGDFPSGSGVEDDTISEASVSDLSRFVPKMPPSPSVPHVISIGQLMESALEVAGQVAGSTVSTSPLPYNAMASQCEKLGTYARKKLSNWLTFENHHYSPAADKYLPPICDNWKSALEKEVKSGENRQVAAASPREPWLAMKLPPASPFDNFLKAAGC